jgi:hypothetical protein
VHAFVDTAGDAPFLVVTRKPKSPPLLSSFHSIVPSRGAALRVIRFRSAHRSPDRKKSLAPRSLRSVRIRVFAALGALAFPSYRPSKFSRESAFIFSVFLRSAITQGSQMPVQIFYDKLPANADLKTSKHFKVIHGFSRDVLTCHLLYGRLAHDEPCPADVENRSFRNLQNFQNYSCSFCNSYLLDCLTAELLPLPFQPVGVCVEYCIILQQRYFRPPAISRSVTACFGSFRGD